MRRRTALPVVAVVGPADIRRAAQHLGTSVTEYRGHVAEVAGCLARRPMLLVANADSESTAVLAQHFRQAGGAAVRLIADADADAAVHVQLHTDVRRLPTRDIPRALVAEADVVVCVGLGPGTALEICLAKFESRAVVLVLRNLVSGPLPSECAFPRLRYVGSVAGLEDALRDLLGEYAAAPAVAGMTCAP